MTKDFLAHFLYPSCSQRFVTGQIVEVNTERIMYGTIRCDCSTYPIIDGILICKHDEKTGSIVKYVVGETLWKGLKRSFEYSLDLKESIMTYSLSVNHDIFINRQYSPNNLRRHQLIIILLHVAKIFFHSQTE